MFPNSEPNEHEVKRLQLDLWPNSHELIVQVTLNEP